MLSGGRPSRQFPMVISTGLVILTSMLSAQRASLAVIDFDGYGIAERDVIALTSRLRSELLRLGSFRVVERSVMQSILAKQNLQLSACTSDECLANIGRLAGAQQAVGGSIGKAAGVFSISARIIDVRTGERLIAVEFDITGQISDALTEGMPKLARLLAAVPQRAASRPTAVRRDPTQPVIPRQTSAVPAQRPRTPAQTSTVPEPQVTTPIASPGLVPKTFVGLDLNMVIALNVKIGPRMGPRVLGISLFGVAVKQYLQPLAAGQFNFYIGYGTDYLIFPYGSFGADFILKNGRAYLGVAVTGRFIGDIFPFPMVAAGLIF